MSKLLALLECPICFDYVSSPVHQCIQGHLVCYNCWKKLSNCSICGSDFSTVRNRPIEQIADFMLYPCVRTGCDSLLTRKELQEHEKTCDFFDKDLKRNKNIGLDKLHKTVESNGENEESTKTSETSEFHYDTLNSQTLEWIDYYRSLGMQDIADSILQGTLVNQNETSTPSSHFRNQVQGSDEILVNYNGPRFSKHNSPGSTNSNNTFATEKSRNDQKEKASSRKSEAVMQNVSKARDKFPEKHVERVMSNYECMPTINGLNNRLSKFLMNDDNKSNLTRMKTDANGIQLSKRAKRSGGTIPKIAVDKSKQKNKEDKTLLAQNSCKPKSVRDHIPNLSVPPPTFNLLNYDNKTHSSNNQCSNLRSLVLKQLHGASESEPGVFSNGHLSTKTEDNPQITTSELALPHSSGELLFRPIFTKTKIKSDESPIKSGESTVENLMKKINTPISVLKNTQSNNQESSLKQSLLRTEVKSNESDSVANSSFPLRSGNQLTELNLCNLRSKTENRTTSPATSQSTGETMSVGQDISLAQTVNPNPFNNQSENHSKTITSTQPQKGLSELTEESKSLVLQKASVQHANVTTEEITTSRREGTTFQFVGNKYQNFSYAQTSAPYGSSFTLPNYPVLRWANGSQTNLTPTVGNGQQVQPLPLIRNTNGVYVTCPYPPNFYNQFTQYP